MDKELRTKAIEIIYNLDSIGRERDQYEYGLPIFNDEYMEKMIAKIIEILGK